MYNSYVILTFIVIVISLVFIIHNKNIERFSSALDHPSKCYSCNNQYPPQSAWRGGKTKCFSCETDALKRSGGNECAVYNEHPIKYYELPPIPGMGYAKMGHM
jgi:hypothetical protein